MEMILMTRVDLREKRYLLAMDKDGYLKPWSIN